MVAPVLLDISIAKKPRVRGEFKIVRHREDGLLEVSDYKGRSFLAQRKSVKPEPEDCADDLPVGFVLRRSRRSSRIRMEYFYIAQASPKWRDRAKIKAIYAESKRRTLETGVQHNVDHIYPIRNDIVCGLHVPENLRIIHARANCRKSNSIPLHDSPAWDGMTILEIKAAVKQMVDEFNGRNESDGR